MGNILYLVVPCYNEEEILEASADKLKCKMAQLIESGKIASQSKVMFINDGSKDKTWSIICQKCHEENIFSGINLSRNFGHQSAILSGMMAAKEVADVVITIDADLQQDIEALDEFLNKYQQGCEIVYGVREDRDSDTGFKKWTALLYYKMLHMLGCKVLTNHADYRLMSKKALDALGEFKEANLFLRGLIPMLGFQSDIVYFEVKKREAGTSKYTLSKMLTLALDGITSLSIKPIRLIMVLGFLICCFSGIMAVVCLNDWFHGRTVPGYTTSILISLILGGVTLLSLGVIGEYIGKIYMETKERPRYIIESVIWNKD
ncbi:MAG: glycosyltransferase family 2 protein [Eubacteriales bacterium]